MALRTSRTMVVRWTLHWSEGKAAPDGSTNPANERSIPGEAPCSRFIPNAYARPNQAFLRLNSKSLSVLPRLLFDPVVLASEDIS
jgi:hypothetical protein